MLNETHTFSSQRRQRPAHRLHAPRQHAGRHHAGQHRVGRARHSQTYRRTQRSTTLCRCLRSPGLRRSDRLASTFSRYQTAVGELNDTVVWTKAAHSFKAGIDARRYELNAIAPPNPTGSFAFTTTGTNTTTATGTAGQHRRQCAGQLSARPGRYLLDRSAAAHHSSARLHLRVLRAGRLACAANLVINAGVRYTLHRPSTETHNQGAVFNTGDAAA